MTRQAEASEQIRQDLERVKASLSEELDGIDPAARRNLSLAYQVRSHPKSFFVGAIGLGYLLFRAGSRLRKTPPRPEKLVVAPNGKVHPPKVSPAPGSLNALLRGPFGQQLLVAGRSLALGGLFGIVRELLKQVVPPTMAQSTGDVIDAWTLTLGAEPMPPGTQEVRPGNQLTAF